MNAPEVVAVLDTNVLLSGLLRGSSTSRRLLEKFQVGAFALAISPELLGELVDVATRSEFSGSISDEALEELLAAIREDALLLHPTERPRVVLPDPDDDALFACALAVSAGYIVSRDKSVLAIKRFRNVKVVSPAEFLAQLPTR